MSENVHNNNNNFPEPEVASSKSLFYLRRQKQQILTFQQLEPLNVWHFCLKNDRITYSIIKTVVISFSVYQFFSVTQHLQCAAEVVRWSHAFQKDFTLTDGLINR